MTNPAIRPLCLALTATLLLGAAAVAEEPAGYDRAAHKASLDASASSSRDQAAIVGAALAARALAKLPTVRSEAAAEARVAAAARGREDRS
jgi:hypothetical protein